MTDYKIGLDPIYTCTIPRATDWKPLLSDEVRRASGDNTSCPTYEPLLAEIAVQLKRIADLYERELRRKGVIDD